MQDVIEDRRDTFDGQEKHDVHGGNVTSLEDENGDADAGYEPTTSLEHDDQGGNVADWGTTESVAAECGSVTDGHVDDDKDDIVDDEITVSSGLALDDLHNEADSLGVGDLQEDNCTIKCAVEIGADRPHAELMNTSDAISDESDELPDAQPKQTGKRTTEVRLHQKKCGWRDTRINENQRRHALVFESITSADGLVALMTM
ncbi:hypothetical protein PF003_g25329 [Phytophthora fragariae]|nr:hypothetical protein PF003_g25329 [Phytophthora fragariae]